MCCLSGVKYEQVVRPSPELSAAHLRPVDAHGVDLVALAALARGLEDQLLAIGREVRLGVLAAEGELLDVGQMQLLGRLGRRRQGRRRPLLRHQAGGHDHRDSHTNPQFHSLSILHHNAITVGSQFTGSRVHRFTGSRFTGHRFTGSRFAGHASERDDNDEALEPARAIAAAIADAGGRAWVVGGFVRDRLLGLDPKDLDLEVFGIAASGSAGAACPVRAGRAGRTELSGLQGRRDRRGAAAARVEDGPRPSKASPSRATRRCRLPTRRAGATSRSTPSASTR